MATTHAGRTGFITPPPPVGWDGWAREEKVELAALRRQQAAAAVAQLPPALLHSTGAADELAAQGLSTTVADARFAKPLDTKLVTRLVREHEVLVTVEEGAIGGFGTHVLHYLVASNQLRDWAHLRTMHLPDRFIGHAAPAEQYHDAGLDAGHIVAEVFKALDQEVKVLGLKAKA